LKNFVIKWLIVDNTSGTGRGMHVSKPTYRQKTLDVRKSVVPKRRPMASVVPQVQCISRLS